ncbi:MAG: hypothetical protein ABIP80_01565 [Ferruginibacter sp.]
MLLYYETTNAEKQLLPVARDQGVAVLINRPLQEGSLFQNLSGKRLPEWSGELGITIGPSSF